MGKNGRFQVSKLALYGGMRKQLRNYEQPRSASGLNAVNHKRQFATACLDGCALADQITALG